MEFPQILDGATGTMLQKGGMPTGVNPELWVLEHPEVAEEFQGRYVQAGSNVLYAPTFGANCVKLAHAGAEDRVDEVNEQLVGLSRKAAGGKAMVAGDLSPTGLFIYPMGDLSFEELVAIYTQQVQALERAGVDLYVVETVMAFSDARAAVLAIRSISEKPIYVTFTVDERGKTLTGTDALAALVTMQEMGVTAFGLNCSSGPDTMLKHLQRLAPHAKVPLIAKPNAGLPRVEGGVTVYDCTPEEFVKYVPELAQAGVRVFGGCCGTTPEHIAALSQAVHGLDMNWSVAEMPVELCAATERDAFFFTEEDLENCVEVVCSEDLEDDLMDADEEDALLIHLTVENAETFAECTYAPHKPLMINTNGNAAAMEAVLRVYQGIAICRKGALEETELNRLASTYGLQIV